MKVSYAAALCGAALALACSKESSADVARCRESVVAATARFAQVRAKAFAKCRGDVVSGKLDPGTDCHANAKVTTTVGAGEAKLRASIDRACGGADRTCDGNDDESLGDYGFGSGVCPDLGDTGCGAVVETCADAADCLVCIVEEGGDALASALYDDLDLASPPRSSLEKCQREIGRAALDFASAGSRALDRCWRDVSRGSAASPCPSPGDGKAAAAILKAEGKAIGRVCKACGGGDKACDEAVGSVGGSGGDDDLELAAIGFSASCPDGLAAGADAGCGGSVDTLADLVACADCLAAQHAECSLAAASQWSEDYPPSCGGDDENDPSLVYAETFDGSAAAWPAEWTEAGGVELADLLLGEARLGAEVTADSLARMVHPAAETDVDVRFTVRMDDVATSAASFFVRHSGGYRQDTPTHGAGYGVSVGGTTGTDALALLREVNGTVEVVDALVDDALGLADGTRFRVRLRATQRGTATSLQAKVWRETLPEPIAWQLDTEDSTPALQSLAGGYAADCASTITPSTPGSPPAELCAFDDVQVRRVANPLDGIGAPVTVAETFTFTEGPLWRPAEGDLLFTDIPASTIHELDPPSSVGVFRAPSDNTNGLGLHTDGDLLACEHGTRRVTRTDPIAGISVVADNYLGTPLNSPNDLAVRSDGTIYFTDPPYGIAPEDQELTFNGIFRVPPGGGLVAEVEGSLAARPNGIGLAPDEATLYVADTDAATLTAYDVAPSGSLSGARVVAGGIFVADGLCIDEDGNVFVTSSSGLQAFSADGAYWGTVAIPRHPANCAFGGADLATIYVTAREGLYSVAAAIAGKP